MINRKQLIKKYLEFFKSKKHKEIQNASLVPENDPTVLFNTAGMQQLVPNLLGQKHPLGKKLVNIQRCIRTGDIDEVGDTTHHTFFEMLGNWSLGDYFKKEAIEMSFEFLTKILKLPKERLAVTCFKGDKNASKDEESAEIWEKLGMPKKKIVFLPKSENWWGPAGQTGPCGPSTEIFYWKNNSQQPLKKFDPEDENWVEIWNDVLMEYVKDGKGNYNLSKQKNVDTGMGVERTLAVLNGFDDDYLTELFKPIIEKIEKLSNKKYKENEKETRIIADHIKASCFIIADGVLPSNTEQGYILRRLIRRAIRYGKELRIKNFTSKIAEPVFKIYDDCSELQKNKDKILEELDKEEGRFNLTLEKGLKIVGKIFKEKEPINKKKFSELMKDPNKSLLIGRIFNMKKNSKNYSLKKPKLSKQEIDKSTINGKESFLLYQSYGFPIEMVDELAMAKGFLVDHNSFREELKKHQKLSRTASVGKFKSGLADNSEATTKLHTATHLLLTALRTVLNDKNIFQKGSNITPGRLRLDFSFPRKLTKEELQEIEDLVNAQIQNSCDVIREEMSLAQAKKKGAIGTFDEKYSGRVFVYSVGDFSKEICAGPHVKNTKELGKFKIKKESSSSSGVRRIKAVLE